MPLGGRQMLPRTLHRISQPPERRHDNDRGMSGAYEVLPDRTICVTGGVALPEDDERIRLESLPPDAALTEAAMVGPASGALPRAAVNPIQTGWSRNDDVTRRTNPAVQDTAPNWLEVL